MPTKFALNYRFTQTRELVENFRKFQNNLEKCEILKLIRENEDC